MRPKLLDIIIIIIASAAVVATSLFAVSAGGKEGEAHVKADAGEFVYSLDKEGKVTLSGPIGNTVLVIENGTIRVIDSPCRDKTCISKGILDSPGEWTACLPNRVFVQIRAVNTGDGPDTVSH